MAAPPALDTRFDAAVQATNDDASISKLSAIRLGYWADPWLPELLRGGGPAPRPPGTPQPRRSTLLTPPRRPPLINRGYFCRHLAFQGVVDSFLDAVEAESSPGVGGGTLLPCSIVALGAGFETGFFRLAASGRRLPAKYVELDFAAVTRRKAAALDAVPALRDAVGRGGGGESSPPAVSIHPGDGRAAGPVYTLSPADLRDAPGVISILQCAGVNPRLPTLVLAECVLAYLPPAAGAALLSELGHWLRPDAACALYDPIRPDDAFGRQMAANLEARGCPLVGVPGAPSPEAQVARFRAGGAWESAAAADLREVWSSRTPPAARSRADAIERLDELEEWHMILEHYALAVAVNGRALHGKVGLPPLVGSGG